MQVERLQELGFCLAARSTSREWLFNDLFSESTCMGGGQKSGLFKLGPLGDLARISAKFRKLFLSGHDTPSTTTIALLAAALSFLGPCAGEK
jgi:hypothetical protein